MVNPRFVIKAVISGQRLNINVPLTVSGAVNYIGVEAKCTSEWDGCTIVCYILQPSTGYYAQLGLIYDQERDLYYFPNAERLVLSAGQWNIWFVGIIAQSGQEKYRVTTETRVFTVYTNEFENRLPPGNITLDEQAIAKATDAQNKANLILDLYNQGKLVGPKGNPGDPAEIGFVQASVDNTAENPACTVTVTENPENTYNMQFAFSGIKGAKGDTGASGPKGDTGAQGTPGRDGRDGEDGQTIDDYVLVQAEQPTSETNKMWLKPTASGDPIMIPSAEEFQGVNTDVANLKSAVNNPVTGLDGKAPIIINSASGIVTRFDDGADGMPLKGLTVDIEPVQAGSGDPSPDNVRPISGWTGCNVTRTGRNLLDPNIAVRANAIINNSGEWETRNGRNTTEGFTPVSPNTPYCFSGPLLGAGVYNVVIFYDESKTFLSRYVQMPANTNAVFTTPPNCYFIRYTFDTSANLSLCQLEKGSVPTDFEPFDNTYPINFPGEAGTVYGGTLTINDDGTGELVVTKRYIERPAYTIINYGGRRAARLDWPIAQYPTSSGSTLCTIAKYANPPVDYSWLRVGANNVSISFTATTTDSEIDAAMQNCAFSLPLVDPITYQLTAEQIATLYGTNNVWADCGPVSVDYPADTKLYIQKINTPTDEDMIADSQIASGKYFIVGNNLYLSTTVIPAGDTIIPGTNCTKTNLAEALNALNT